MRTDEVLEQISDAVADLTTSADAMRCGAPPGTGPGVDHAFFDEEQLDALRQEILDEFVASYRRLVRLQRGIDLHAYRRRQLARRRRRRR